MSFSTVINAETPKTINERTFSSIINPETSAMITTYWHKLPDAKDGSDNSNENKQVNIQSFLEECADIVKGEEKDFDANDWRKLTTYLLLAGEAHVVVSNVNNGPPNNPKASACYLSAITVMKKIPEEKYAQTEWPVLYAWQNKSKPSFAGLNEPLYSDGLILAICYMRRAECFKAKSNEEFTRFISLAITTLENLKNHSTLSSERLLATCHRLKADSLYGQTKTTEEKAAYNAAITILKRILEHPDTSPTDVYAIAENYAMLSNCYPNSAFDQKIKFCLEGLEYLEKMDTTHHTTEYWQKLGLMYREATVFYHSTNIITSISYAKKSFNAFEKIPKSERNYEIWDWMASALVQMKGPLPDDSSDKGDTWHTEALGYYDHAIKNLHDTPEDKRAELKGQWYKHSALVHYRIGMAYAACRNYKKVCEQFAITDTTLKVAVTRQSHPDHWEDLIRNKADLSHLLLTKDFEGRSYKTALQSYIQLFNYLDEAAKSEIPFSSPCFSTYVDKAFDALSAYVKEQNNKPLQKELEKNIFEAECRQALTRFLSYVDPNTIDATIKKNGLVPLLKLLNGKIDTDFKNLKETLKKEFKAELGKQKSIMPPGALHADKKIDTTFEKVKAYFSKVLKTAPNNQEPIMPPPPLHIKESAVAIYNASRTLPVQGYHQAETWVNNRSLRVLMLQKPDPKSTPPILGVRYTNVIWFHILEMLGGISQKQNDAELFTKNMRFFTQKKLLLLQVNAKVSSTPAETAQSKSAKKLKNAVAEAKDSKTMLKVLEAHRDEHTRSITPAQMEADDYSKMLVRHINRMT